MAKYKGVTIIPGIVFDKQGNQITSLEKALTEEAQCGCSLNCCEGTLSLRNPDTGELVVITAAEITALLALLD